MAKKTQLNLRFLRQEVGALQVAVNLFICYTLLKKLPVAMLIIEMITLLFWVYTIMLFVRILGSWFPEYQRHKVFLFISFYTDPYLNIFRSIIPPLGMIDISPIVAFLCLSFIEQALKAIVIFFLV